MSNYSDSSFDENNANTSWYKVFHLIPRNSKVLDVGSSSGNFGAELIKRKGCVVDGVEINDADFEEAKKKLNTMYKLNIETDPLDGITNKYDFIYFGDVIEHLVDPIKTLKRIKQLLKPSGKVLFSIPNMAHISVRLLLLMGDFEYTKTGLLDRTHLHFYGLDEVYRVFTEAGYDIDHMDFVKQDYPKPLIKEWLDKAGLQGSDTFYKAMSKPEAAAFQFVGTAVVAKTKKVVKRKDFGPVNDFDRYHTQALKTLRRELEAAISSRDQTIEKKNFELETIKSSRVWKLRNMIVKLIGRGPAED